MTNAELSLIKEAAGMLKRAMDHLDKTDRLVGNFTYSPTSSPYAILNERRWDLLDFVESQTYHRLIN